MTSFSIYWAYRLIFIAVIGLHPSAFALWPCSSTSRSMAFQLLSIRGIPDIMKNASTTWYDRPDSDVSRTLVSERQHLFSCDVLFTIVTPTYTFLHEHGVIEGLQYYFLSTYIYGLYCFHLNSLIFLFSYFFLFALLNTIVLYLSTVLRARTNKGTYIGCLILVWMDLLRIAWCIWHTHLFIYSVLLINRLFVHFFFTSVCLRALLSDMLGKSQRSGGDKLKKYIYTNSHWSVCCLQNFKFSSKS